MSACVCAFFSLGVLSPMPGRRAISCPPYLTIQSSGPLRRSAVVWHALWQRPLTSDVAAMNLHATSRVSAAIALGIAVSFAIPHISALNDTMGNVEYAQPQRYEHYYVNPPNVPNAPASPLTSLIGIGLFVGAYELLAYGIYTVMKSKVGAPGA